MNMELRNKVRPLDIHNSTKEQREQYIKETFKCRADCDSCGLCAVLRGKTPEVAYADYIDGIRDFSDVAAEYR